MVKQIDLQATSKGMFSAHKVTQINLSDTVKQVDLPAMSKRTFSAHETIHFAGQDAEEKGPKKAHTKSNRAASSPCPWPARCRTVAESGNPAAVVRGHVTTGMLVLTSCFMSTCSRGVWKPSASIPSAVSSCVVSNFTSATSLTFAEVPVPTVVLSVCLCFFAVMLIACQSSRN